MTSRKTAREMVAFRLERRLSDADALRVRHRTAGQVTCPVTFENDSDKK
jgi:hypothetical protein